MTTYTVSKRFLDDLQTSSAESVVPAILTTIRDLTTSPDASGLKVGKVEFADVWYCRVNRDWRMLFQWGAGKIPILLRVVKHRVFDRLRAKDLGEYTLVNWLSSPQDTEDSSEFQVPEAWQRPSVNATYPLRPFTQHQLRLLGIPAHLAGTLRDAPTLEDALETPTLPERARTWLLTLGTDPAEPLRDPFKIFKQASLEQLEAFTRGQIQDLLLQLAPDQQVHVDRVLSGATLLKGVAGSGKTTVGIHRAVNLAQAGRQVLFITYNPILRQVTRSLMAEVTGTLPDTLQVVDYRQWAQGLLKQGDEPLEVISPTEAMGILDTLLTAQRATRQLAVLSRPTEFFYEEIQRVIKGFGLQDLDAYLSVPRYGRKQALSARARAVVWEVMTAYNKELNSLKKLDWGDVVLRLYKTLLSNTEICTFDDVIVDEAQDLTPLELRVLQRLIRGKGNSQKSMLVLGDAAQSLYSRGFSWKQVGLDIRGRAYTLKTNYRNTQEIVLSASGLAERNIHLKDQGELIDMVSVYRQGPRPVLIFATGQHELKAFVIEETTRFREENILRLRDVAVITVTAEAARDYVHVLNAKGIPADHWGQDADDVDVLRESVKVMTIKEAKGLEFPVVFITDLTARVLGTPGAETEREERDIVIERDRMQLYVGMTRSAEILYLLAHRGHTTPFLDELSAVEVRTLP